MFDTAKVEASQRALAHAVDVMRCRAAAAAAATAIAGAPDGDDGLSGPVSPRLAVNPEGLCLALRACVENGGGGGVGGGFGGAGGGHHAPADAAAAAAANG